MEFQEPLYWIEIPSSYYTFGSVYKGKWGLNYFLALLAILEPMGKQKWPVEPSLAC